MTTHSRRFAHAPTSDEVCANAFSFSPTVKIVALDTVYFSCLKEKSYAVLL